MSSRKTVHQMCAAMSKMNEPVAEDPEEWVLITDQKHIVRKGIDQVCLVPSSPHDQRVGMWSPARESVGHAIGDWPGYEFQCRRKDLPAVNPAVHPMCEAMSSCSSIVM